MQFSKNLEDNLEHLKQTLSLEKNFDVVYRVVSIGGKKGCLLFVDGLTKDEVLLKILQAWWSIKPEDLPADAHGFSGKYMPYGEVGLIANEEDMIVQLLSGITAVLIDGYDKCMMIDCRTYPARGVGEPEKDKVLRGSRDGFVHPDQSVKNYQMCRAPKRLVIIGGARHLCCAFQQWEKYHQSLLRFFEKYDAGAGIR